MAIIKARHIGPYMAFFRFYTRWKIKRHFRKVYVEHDNPSCEGPVLLVGNHFSWWDGFIGYLLNMELFRKRFHVMMLEEQLKNRMFLNKAGAFSIKKSSKSLIESLVYCSDLLSDRRNLLLLFPQGRIETLYKRDFVFEPGVERILKELPEPPGIWFMVNLVDYFSRPKPSLFVRTRKYDGDLAGENIRKAFNRFFDECIAKQSEELL